MPALFSGQRDSVEHVCERRQTLAVRWQNHEAQLGEHTSAVSVCNVSGGQQSAVSPMGKGTEPALRLPAHWIKEAVRIAEDNQPVVGMRRGQVLERGVRGFGPLRSE